MKYGKSLLFLAAATTLTGCPGGAVLSVNTTADTKDTNPGDGVCEDAAGQCSLRAAIEEANQGQGAEIRLVSGETYFLGAVRESLKVEKNITISGAFAPDGSTSVELPNAIVRPAAGLRILEVGTPSTSSGPGIVASLTAKNLTLQGVRLSTGAGSANSGGAVTILTGSTFVGENVNVLDNEAERGAAFQNSGTLRLRGGNISNNRCNQSQPTRGGAILSSGTLELVEVSLTNNTCDSGAAIRSDGGSVNIAGATFVNNRAYNDGAAITSSNSNVEITTSTIVENNQLSDPSRPQSSARGAINFVVWDRGFFNPEYEPDMARGAQVFATCSQCHHAPNDPASAFTFSLINPAKYTRQALAAKIHSDMSRYFPEVCQTDSQKAQCSMDVAGFLAQNAVGPDTSLVYGDSPTVKISDSMVANNFGSDSGVRNCTIAGATFAEASVGNIFEDLGTSSCGVALPVANTQVADLATDAWRFSYVDARTRAVVPSTCSGQTPPGPSLFPRYTPECWQEFTFSNAPVVATCVDERGVECSDPRAW